MATPYGHALVGLSLFNLMYPHKVIPRIKAGLLYGLVVLVTLSPDLDFLPGILLGNTSRFHQGPSHSLGMAIGLSLVGGLIISIIWRDLNFFKISRLIFLLVFSHLLLDFFTEDLKPPFGFPFFWPVTETCFLSPWPIIPHVSRDIADPKFWGHNMMVVLFESLLFLPLFFLSWKCGNYPKEKGQFKK